MRYTLLLPAILLAALSSGAELEGSVWDGTYTTPQADRGARLFIEHCIACHSNKAGEMSGHGPAPSVLGEDFTFRWYDASIADLYDAIRQTMPEGAPNSLAPDQYADLTAYVLHLNGFPSGATALEAENYDALQNIWIEPDYEN